MKLKQHHIRQLFWLCLINVLFTLPALAKTGNVDNDTQHDNTVAIDGVYDEHYAQDFARCPQHFYAQTPPKITQKTAGELYELCFYGFATLYSSTSYTALYSAHHLRADDIAKARRLPRVDSFRPETRLPKRLQVHLKDYKGRRYDRGHIVPNGDMYDKQSQYDSFSLANIVPQNREHNRGVWRKIESYTRDLASEFGDVYVVTGVAFEGKKVTTMGKVFVPSHLYKAVYIPSERLAGVYYSPNDGSGRYEVIDLKTLEQRTGVIAFDGVRADFDEHLFLMETPIERQPTGFWHWLGLILQALLQALS